MGVTTYHWQTAASCILQKLATSKLRSSIQQVLYTMYIYNVAHVHMQNVSPCTRHLCLLCMRLELSFLPFMPPVYEAGLVLPTFCASCVRGLTCPSYPLCLPYTCMRLELSFLPFVPPVYEARLVLPTLYASCVWGWNCPSHLLCRLCTRLGLSFLPFIPPVYEAGIVLPTFCTMYLLCMRLIYRLILTTLCASCVWD